MYGGFQQHIQRQLQEVRDAGTWKRERVMTTPQRAHVGVVDRPGVLNLCANNYLGLADHPELIEAAHRALDQWGYGMASVRFICGTQEIHTQLEEALSKFLQTEATILYGSAFDANGGLFETLLGPEDAVISDQLNHASIIDGIRLSKAKRYRYANNDMDELETRLQEADAEGARFKLITSDGVFSMDGYIARLDVICDLADRYGALVHFDDCHATGFLGANGRGTHEYHNVVGRVDITTGTLGKAVGGASGGYTSGRKEIIEWLRQRSRPYLFSNSVAPPIVGASLCAIDLITRSPELRDRLHRNTRLFRDGMTERGFDVLPGDHPITPIMIGDAALANEFADRMLQRGVYVVGFSYPVVPRGQARIRAQMSAAHSRDDLVHAMDMFSEVKAELGT